MLCSDLYSACGALFGWPWMDVVGVKKKTYPSGGFHPPEAADDTEQW